MLGLQADGDHPLLQHAAASLYELIASFVAKFDLPFILFPNRGIVYRLLGSADVTAVSRMCGILLQYKSEVESLKKRKEQSDTVVRFLRVLFCWTKSIGEFFFMFSWYVPAIVGHRVHCALCLGALCVVCKS